MTEVPPSGGRVTPGVELLRADGRIVELEWWEAQLDGLRTRAARLA